MTTRRTVLWFLAVVLLASVPAYAQMDLAYSSGYGTRTAVDPATGDVYMVKGIRPQFSDLPPITDFSTPPVGQEMGWWVAKASTKGTCVEPDPDHESLCWGSFPLVAAGAAPLYAIALGPNGDVYATGWGGDTFLTTPGAYNEIDPGGRAMYVARFSGVDGSLVAFTFFNTQQVVSVTQPRAIHVGPNGWVTVTGYTTDPIPTTSTAYQSSLVGGGDAFVAIFNQDLSNVGGPDGDGLIYASILPSGTDLGEGLAALSNGSGKAWIGGYASSTDLDTEPFQGGYSSTPQGGTDGFLLEIDPSQSGLASITWATLFGGSADDDITSLALDGAGNFVVAGSTASSGLALQRSFKGGLDAFVAAITPGGTTLIDGTYLGGKGTDLGVGVQVDSSGNILTAGSTQSRDFPVVNAYDSSHNSRRKDDIFVTRLDPLFGITHSTFLGGDGQDTCWAFHLDTDGSAYVSGSTDSSNFPYTVNSTYLRGVVVRFDFGTVQPPGNVTVTGISPAGMDAGTSISGVTITGAGFATGAAVTFENGSGPTPTASSVVVFDANTITLDVTVGSGGPPGPRVWDVRVTNQDASTGVLSAGFTVTK